MKLDLLNNTAIIQSSTFGLNTVLFLLISGGIVWGFYYVLRNYVDPLIESEKFLPKFQLLRFRFEVFSWFVFFLFWMVYLLNLNALVVIIVVALVGTIGFQFWRDFFPGLLFRLSSVYTLGDKVVFAGITGEIEKFGITAVLLKTKDEAMLFLPYRKLVDDVRLKKQSKGKLLSQKVILSIGNHHPDVFIELTEKWVFQCPWAISQGNSNASLLDPQHIVLNVYAVDQSSLIKIEQFLKQKAKEFN